MTTNTATKRGRPERNADGVRRGAPGNQNTKLTYTGPLVGDRLAQYIAAHPLRVLRERSKRDAEYMGWLVDVDAAQWTAWERGREEMPGETVEKLSQFFAPGSGLGHEFVACMIEWRAGLEKYR